MVHCQLHGSQDETFVCQHIAASLHTRTPVGFHWPETATELRPDAWCTECHRHLESAGWEWTPEAEAFAHISILCGACYDHARELNLARPSLWPPALLRGLSRFRHGFLSRHRRRPTPTS